jgi:DNA-binding NtrC family response regulator
MTTRMLERQGYQVLAAATPAEAMRLAGQQAGEIRLLMTDVVMPEMNGRDLARHLLSHNAKLKCLFMSGYTAEVMDNHRMLNEEMHFIQKPFIMKDLTTKVREILDNEPIG